ncbi:MAG: BON domain-containing protein [Bryobacterales bacterium]|nr:BON domain-containing protein [Bryobacterales bacterium]MBV9397164.1 BON domain-containing protein [Bryobacterales bacterium]
MTAKTRFLTAGVIAALALVPVASYASNGGTSSVPLEERVRHELAKIPYYNVFDSLSFRVDDGTVTLFGQVTQPVVKDDAASAVKHIEGVRTVKNEIEVLPLSPFDNQIRRSEYRAIYGYAPLQRYSMGVVPSIHIIVKNGHVTLEGVVATQQDKQLAYVRANGVPNVFSVENNLRVQS